MIRSFKDKETQKIFNRSFSTKLPIDIQHLAIRKLKMLNRSNLLADLRVPPGNNFEILKGNRKNQYSIQIKNEWRICFKLNAGEVEAVEIVQDVRS